jgi:hypothetical protein
MRSATSVAAAPGTALPDGGALGLSSSRAPHFLQNLAPLRLLSPQCGQLPLKGDPHSSQKSASASLRPWQLRQIMPG